MEAAILSRALDQVTFTVLDVETTGLNPCFGDRVCEIALLRCESGREVDRFHSMVNPGRPISPGASAVNGITAKDLLGAPASSDIGSGVLRLLGDSVAVARNRAIGLSKQPA